MLKQSLKTYVPGNGCVMPLQDIGGIQTPWGQVTAVGMNPYQGSATGRKLLQATDAQGRLVAEGTKPVRCMCMIV